MNNYLIRKKQIRNRMCDEEASSSFVVFPEDRFHDECLRVEIYSSHLFVPFFSQ